MGREKRTQEKVPPESLPLEGFERWMDNASQDEFEEWDRETRRHPLRTWSRMVMASIKQDPVTNLLIPMSTSVITVLLMSLLRELLR